MGVYLNPGNEKFAKAVQSEIYVDKTGLIEYTNQVLNTVQRYVCVSRPRRFGKSMTADMLTAYYGKECDSRELFSGLKISQNAVFAQHLNQYPTIFLNMQEFLSRSKEIGQVIDRVRRMLLRELKNSYPDVDYFDDTDLVESMQDIYAATKQSFVIIIDEWDCVFREYQQDKKAQEEYLDFLRDFLKDKVYVALAYLTGILPIKKYGTHSALNMFDEFTMLDPGPLAEYVGFTEQEVEELCGRYQMDLAEIKNWYDGYSFPGETSVYSPRSVVNAMRFRKIGNYWNQTETFEALQWYIDLNFDGNLSSKEAQDKYIQIQDADGNVLSQSTDKNGKQRYELKPGKEYTLIRKIPQDYYKLITWKLEVSSNRNSYIHTSVTGYAKQKNNTGTKQKINVLQLLPNRDSHWNLKTDETFKSMISEVEDFDIDVETISVDTINNYNYNEVQSILKDKQMLVLGFADVYQDIKNNNGQVNAILDFVKSGKSIIFAHDTTSYVNYDYDKMEKKIVQNNYEESAAAYVYNDTYLGNRNNRTWGYSLNTVLRSVVGMDRYGITSTEQLENGKTLSEVLKEVK